MPKTPDEIKKAMLHCSPVSCRSDDCPYKDDTPKYEGDMPVFRMKLWHDMVCLIQQLQYDNAQLNRCIENMTDKLNAMNSEVAKLQAERDAAVETIYEMAKCITEDVCEWCDGVECERLCMQHTILRPGFKWRGVQKEDGDA